MKTFILLGLLLNLGTMTSIAQQADDFDRKIELEGEPNFRDLGGYQTAGGQALKKGLLYRSGNLYKLTVQDVERLKALGIKTVVNFLTDSERENSGADRLPEGVRSVFLPIEGMGNEVDDLIAARKTGDFSKIPTDFNYRIHKDLPETGKTAYAELYTLMADENNYPIVFHCSHGIHRTGTAAAILLTSLEVPWETVSADYMLSSSYRMEESKKRVDQLVALAAENPAVKDQAVNQGYIEDFYFLKPEYIAGTKSHILDKYGSFSAYLQSAGLTPEQIQAIKSVLLEE